MSIVTFWSDGKEQTGKTLSIAAVSTYMAIEHNYRILVVSTGFKDDTLDRCFWEDKKVKRNLRNVWTKYQCSLRKWDFRISNGY